MVLWFYFYLNNQFCKDNIIYSFDIWNMKNEEYYQNQYWYQYSFQILVSKWDVNSILIEYYLQQSY